MDSDLKLGGAIGAVFAGLAYLITYQQGFNSTTLTYLLYMYIILGFMVAFDGQDFVEGRKFLDRLVLVGKDEEKKLKKVFSDEEYRIDGNVEKVSDA
jgi:hypothetical protein